MSRSGSLYEKDAAKGMTEREIDPKMAALLPQRAAVLEAVRGHRYEEAAAGYVRLLDQDAEHVLPEQPQLDVANHLMARREYAQAAKAYSLFLKTFPSYVDRHQVQLILGLIYAKYLNDKPRARQLLTDAQPRLVGSHRVQADQVLSELGPA